MTSARRWVKICGVTRARDAQAAVEAGADLIGLNFHPASPRALEIAAAKRIVDAIAGAVPVVGVFVERSVAEIEAIEEAVGLNLIQFHGPQGAEEVARFGPRALPVLRGLEGLSPSTIATGFDPFAAYARAWGLLIDVAAGPAEGWGGTGKRWDYGRLGPWLRSRPSGAAPVLIAGGIGPDNAARALAESGADGIDVCSAIESAPGIKDRGAMEDLIKEVRDGQSASAAG